MTTLKLTYMINCLMREYWFSIHIQNKETVANKSGEWTDEKSENSRLLDDNIFTKRKKADQKSHHEAKIQ